MKKKEKKLRSFAKRLTRWLILMMILTMGLASYFLYDIAKEFSLSSDGMLQEAFLDGSVKEIGRVTSDVYVGTLNHVPEIEESLGQPERLYTLMERVVSLNPHIRSCGISFIADYYPQKGHWFCPYATRRDSDNIERLTIGDANHDYLQTEWFNETLKAKEGFWSKPFFDGNDSITPLVSCLFPIHDKTGRTVAVLGADMSLKWLQKKMEKMDWNIFSKEWVSPSKEKIEELKKKPVEFEKGKLAKFQPYSFLIAGDGTYLAHPDRKRILHENFLTYAKQSPDTALNYVARQMLAGEKGYYGMQIDLPMKMQLDGRLRYVFYAPINHTDWSMALAIPAHGLDLFGTIIAAVLLFLIALGLLVVSLFSHFFIRRATKPLNQLALSADEVAKGNFHTQLPVIKHHDEVGLLRDSFDGMQQSLAKYVEQLKATTASKAAIENELQVAHDIQMGMLPKIFPPYPERDDIDIYGSLTPAKEVGGDLFDFYIRDNQMFFCIGDVSGKGVPASLVMAVTRSLFRNISMHTAVPDQIVSALNEVLTEGNETIMFVTSFIGVLDLATGILRYCNAGHDAPILISQGIEQLPCDSNIPLGVMSGWKYTTQEAVIAPQTTIFLFTDGLTEAEDSEHTQFGTERIVAVAEKLLSEGKNTPEEIIGQMAEGVHAFVGSAEQSDDQTMLAIKYKG